MMSGFAGNSQAPKFCVSKCLYFDRSASSEAQQPARSQPCQPEIAGATCAHDRCAQVGGLLPAWCTHGGHSLSGCKGVCPVVGGLPAGSFFAMHKGRGARCGRGNVRGWSPAGPGTRRLTDGDPDRRAVCSGSLGGWGKGALGLVLPPTSSSHHRAMSQRSHAAGDIIAAPFDHPTAPLSAQSLLTAPAPVHTWGTCWVPAGPRPALTLRAVPTPRLSPTCRSDPTPPGPGKRRTWLRWPPSQTARWRARPAGMVGGSGGGGWASVPTHARAWASICAFQVPVPRGHAADVQIMPWRSMLGAFAALC